MSVHAETAPYLAAFAAQRRGAEPDWLTSHRAAALARFGALGFPTRRDESWRFTDLKPLQRRVFPPAGASEAKPLAEHIWRFPDPCYRFVIRNGRFSPGLSDLTGLPKGAWVKSTAQTLAERPTLVEMNASDVEGKLPFASLNAALFGDGFTIGLDEGVVVDRPIEIVHIAESVEPVSFHLRSGIRLGANSRLTLVETFVGEGDYWTNAVVDIDVGPGAALRHVKLQDEAPTAIHFGQARTTLGKDARYESFVLTLGGRLTRHDSFVKFDGEDAACGLFGAYLLRGEQEATNATFVDHAVPRCTTKEVFKGVIDERAHGVFLGRIAVRPQAQKTNAHQLNKNLLLSPRANVDTKPELEILADDVKCSHGATVGDLDEEALFYLEARGIPAPEARRMLIEAFATDAIDQIEDDAALRAFLAAHVQRWLGRHGD